LLRSSGKEFSAVRTPPQKRNCNRKVQLFLTETRTTHKRFAVSNSFTKGRIERLEGRRWEVVYTFSIAKALILQLVTSV